MILFLLLQMLLVPKWYYPDTVLPESPTRTVTGFYEEPNNSLDVIVVGASTVLYGYSPMCVYEKYGIKSYNFATSAQPIQVAYFALKEAFCYQSPQVVVMDASSLLGNGVDESRWRYFLDNMPFSINKVEMAKEFSKRYGKENFLGAIMPLFRYHDRWIELQERDFTDFFRNKSFYSKGYFLNSLQNAAGTVDSMNEYAQIRAEVKTNKTERYINGVYSMSEINDSLYQPIVSNENLSWLLKIKDMCEANQAELVVVKVPANYFPTGWSNIKNDVVKKTLEEYHITYYDMMYDHSVPIDWNVDTRDYGGHLNILGAQKVSECLGAFLSTNYNLDGERNDVWDKNLELYLKVRDLAMLQMDLDFSSYMYRLKTQCKDETVFIVASDDFYNNLTESDKELLKSLGLKTRLENLFRSAFVAVIENETVTYEAVSNREVTYEGKTRYGHNYQIHSAGWLSGSGEYVRINGISYAMNGRGLNFVVYDDKRDLVLDNACFDTSLDHTGKHSSQVSEVYLRKFENYIIEQGE